MGVGSHIKQMQKHEDRFVEKYGLERNENQKAGIAWDAKFPNTDLYIEFKADLMAAKTGNTFVEFSYSKDGDVFRPSGIELAVDQADFWVIQVGDSDDYRWFLVDDLKAHIDTYNFRTASIRKGINGNSELISCIGHIVPLTTLKHLEIDTNSDDFKNFIKVSTKNDDK